MRHSLSVPVALAAMVFAGQSLATDPFSATLQVGTNPPVERGYSSLEDLLEQFTNQSLRDVEPSYTQNSAAQADINLRGLTGVSLFYNQNSPILYLHISSLGVQQQFNGATRDESEDMLEEWFKGDGRAILTKLLNNLAAVSPIDPMAGNPNSLMAKMVDADFTAATQLMETVADATGDTPKNFFGISARLGQYSQGSFGASVLSIPLAYTHVFEDSRYALNLDLPVTYVSNDGAATWSASLGAGLRVPVVGRWSLTPGVRVGIVGSADLGSGGVIYSAGVTSNYRLDSWGPFTLSIADMLAYYWTGPVSVGDYDVGYDLGNTVMRNGLLGDVDAGFAWFEVPMEWQFGYVRTDYFGDALYSTVANDFSVSLGSRRRAGHLVWNALRVGLTYTIGNGDISGVSANMGYTF